MPHADASLTTIGLLSKTDGSRNISLCEYMARSLSRSRTAPVNMQSAARPESAAYFFMASRSEPSPTKSIVKACPADFIFLSPSMIIFCPLYHIMRPTKRKTGRSAGMP